MPDGRFAVSQAFTPGGTVSQHVVSNAACPVLVYPAKVRLQTGAVPATYKRKLSDNSAAARARLVVLDLSDFADLNVASL